MLRLENISGDEITVHYSFRAIKTYEDGRFEQDKMVYKTEIRKPGEKKSESSYPAHNGKIGFYYVDSFMIMNVAVTQSSKHIPRDNRNQAQNSTTAQQSITVPQWAQGVWGRSEGGTKITSTQFIQPSVGIALSCTRVLGNSVHFEGVVYQNNFAMSLYAVVNRMDSPDKLKVEIYFNGETNPRVSEYSQRRQGH